MTGIATMTWLLAVFELSSAARRTILITAAVAAVLAVVAPLLAALALRDGATFPVWWLGLSGLMWIAIATVAISRRRELGLGGNDE
jgi:Zn-dependent protease with chaperone function